MRKLSLSIAAATALAVSSHASAQTLDNMAKGLQEAVSAFKLDDGRSSRDRG